MSQCPYAIEAEKTIIPIVKKFKNEVDFNLYFIAEENYIESSEKSFEAISENSEAIDTQNINRYQGQAVADGGKFKSLHGKSEIEEDIRQVVMAKYYPDKYLDYLMIRSENYSTDNWEECATS